MTAIAPDRIRTVAVLGHSHDGKTTLCEALLFAAGAVARMGSTDSGTSLFDHEPEEQRHSMSIDCAVAHFDWQEYRINLIDAPGFQDFAGEVAAAISAADGVVLVVGAGGQVPVGAELAWEMAAERGLPIVVVVNKLDKENAQFDATVAALRLTFGKKAIATAIPIGSADKLLGHVDLVDGGAYRWEEKGRLSAIDVPGEMRSEIEKAHTDLVEAVAETDDALIAKYLEGAELAPDEVRAALHMAAAKGDIVPIVCAVAIDARGATLVADTICRYVPSPLERACVGADANGKEVEVKADLNGNLVAQIFKTAVDNFGKVSYVKVFRGTIHADTHPFNATRGTEERFTQLGQPMGKTVNHVDEVGAGDIAVLTKLPHALTGDSLCAKNAIVQLPTIDLPKPLFSAAITAKSKGDDDKIMSALVRLTEEDAAFHTDRDPVTNESLVHGLGDVHLNVVLEKMKRKYGVEAVLQPPRIPYRETIAGTARVAHKYKKQSGGAGLYGDCTIEIEPLPRGTGYQWEDKIFGGSIPQQFRPSVEKGVKQTLEQGAISGNPIVDVKVTLVDGSTHPVDGKDIAFQIAGSMAMREAVQKARPLLLEPVMDVRVVVPERFMGDVISLLNAKRGHVAGMNPLGEGRSEVSAQVPQAEMYSFPIELRAATQGRGRYSMELAHYQEVPAHITQQIVEAHSHEPAAV